jgi:hypothetical protein
MSKLKLTSRNARSALACAAFALVSVPLALNDGASWLWVVCGGLMAAALLVERRPDDFLDELEISDTALTRRFGFQHGERKQESVAWSDIERIVIKTGQGLASADFYYMLFGKDQNGVIVTEDVARRQRLLPELERRFPNFDHHKFLQAAGSRLASSHTVWERGAL